MGGSILSRADVLSMYVGSYHVLLKWFHFNSVYNVKNVCFSLVLLFLLDILYIFVNYSLPNMFQRWKLWWEVPLWLDVSNYHVCLQSGGFCHVLLCESKWKNSPCSSRASNSRNPSGSWLVDIFSTSQSNVGQRQCVFIKRIIKYPHWHVFSSLFLKNCKRTL